MRALWSIGTFVAGQLFLLIVVLGYEKMTGKRVDDMRSLRTMPTWKYTLLFGVGVGLLSCLLNRPFDSGGGINTSHVLSAFLTYGVGFPLYGTLGMVALRPFGLAGLGQIGGGIYAGQGSGWPLVAAVLSHFGVSYCVWWLP